MRKLMWFAIGFCIACGVGISAYSALETPLWLLIGAGFLCIGLLLAARHFAFLQRPGVLALGLAVGLCWFTLYDSAYLDTSRHLDGEITETSLEITDYPSETNYGINIAAKLKMDSKTYQVMLYINDYVSLKPGDMVKGTFRFRFTSQGGSKDPTYHPSEGVFLLAYQSGNLSVDSCEEILLRHFPAVIRKTMEDSIDQSFPADAAPFAKALLLGQRQDIDYETNTAFKLSGLSHIVAVSGLHVSILFSLLYIFTARKRAALFLLGLPLLLLFAAITGFTPSVVRACIMQALVLLALLLDKEYDPPTALAFSGLTMLICNPMVLLSISFQLTMACMAGIFLFREPIRNYLISFSAFKDLKGKGLLQRVKRWVVTSLSVSGSAMIFTTPILAWHFGTVSLVSLLSNLLLVWMVSGIFYGIMLTCLLGLVTPFLANICGWLFAIPIRLLTGTAKLLSKFPLSAVYTESIYIVMWLLFVYVLFAVFLLLRKKHPGIFAAMCIVGMCVALMASWIEPMLDDCRVTVLDVGQGQSILLQSNGKSFLVDCGGKTDVGSADIAAEAVLSQGVARLDGIIVTHFDTDHAGGVSYLLSRVSADKVFLPDLSKGNAHRESIELQAAENTYFVTKDIILEFGGTKLTIFAPESDLLENECSICVLFQT